MKNLFLTITVSLTVFAFTACNSNISGTSQGEWHQPKKMSFSSAEEQLQYRTNEFSMNMLSLIGRNDTQHENICFSPLSCNMALGILMNGAAGETLAQMEKTLGFEGVPEDSRNTYYHKIADLLPYLDSTTVIKIANALWLREDYPVLKEYKDKSREVFNATIDNVDTFTKQSVIDMINKWAEDNTNGLIKNVLNPDMVSENTVMIFANALYFKGMWHMPFSADLTRKQKFTTLSNQEIQADMMHQYEASILYGEDESLQIVELDYKDHMYCIDFILPKENVSVSSLLKDLTLDRWTKITQLLSYNDVNLSIPKFKFVYERMLTEDLQKAGIVDAFNANAADFTRLSEVPGCLSWVKQKCYISIDEKSTEAAAVTIGGYYTTSALGPEPKVFIADHPFIFVIREKQYGTILFTGIIGNPAE